MLVKQRKYHIAVVVLYSRIKTSQYVDTKALLRDTFHCLI